MAHSNHLGLAGKLGIGLLIAGCAAVAAAQGLDGGAHALLAIDKHRASVVERVIDDWGAALAKSNVHISIDELRTRLMALRADQLLAASLAGTLDGLREVIGATDASFPSSRGAILGQIARGQRSRSRLYPGNSVPAGRDARDVCRGVSGRRRRGACAGPVRVDEIRSYTLQGGNGICLSQLPVGLPASAVQLQVFGIPTTPGSGDIEILPQGTTFGSTATMVYVGSIAFNTVSTATKVNLANRQISVQVRGGGAHLAIDVVGYFAAPTGNGGKFFQQGGNAFGTVAALRPRTTSR